MVCTPSQLLHAGIYEFTQQAKRSILQPMSTVKEIESAITGLSREELAELRSWFQGFAPEAWDRQIESDAASGRLDAFYERLQKENAGEPGVPLHDFLDDKKLS